LTLRANEAGGGHIVIGSGVSLRPEVDCTALDAIDLGQEELRWKTLYSCSGNFLDRPSVNGSGVLLQGEAAGGGGGVTSIEGLAGVVDLDSPDDSITINVSSQIIELTTTAACASGFFTPASGTQFVVQHGLNTELFSWHIWRNDVDPLRAVIPVNVAPSGNRHAIIELQSPMSGVAIFNCGGGPQGPTGASGLTGDAGTPGAVVGVESIEGISGVIDLDSPDDSINIQVNSQIIELTTPTSGAPSGASYILTDYNDNNHLVDARKLSATSGITLDDQGARSASGIVLKLDFDNEPAVGEVLSWTGSKLGWITAGGDFLPSASGAVLSLSQGIAEYYLASDTGSFTTTLTPVPFDTTIVEDSTYYSRSTGTITINAAGWYRVSYNVNTNQIVSSSRSTARTQVTLNGSTVVPQGTSWSYHRNTTDGEGTASKSFIMELAAGDTLEVETQRNSGASTYEHLAGSNFSIELVRYL